MIKIISAAIRFRRENDIIIIPLHRHYDGFQILHDLHIPYRSEDIEQGFIAYDPRGHKEWFVNRVQAYEIAYQARQLSPMLPPPQQLFSEDLW